MINIALSYHTSCRSMDHHGEDDGNVIVIMITWHRSMMIMLIQDHNHSSNLTIKEHHEVGGQGSWPRGSGAKTSKKGGSGGVPKIAKFCTRGGEIWGGVFLGGSPKTGVIKHGVL